MLLTAGAIGLRQKIMSTKIQKTAFQHISTRKNPEYEAGLTSVPFRSCLIHNKSDKITNEVTANYQWKIQNNPKWLTRLQYLNVDTETGEVIDHDYLDTNNQKASNARKIKALDKWCGVFQPLYQKKKVSMLFYTFTQADKARVDIKQMIETLSKRYERKGKKILGYVWTLEVSEKKHIHYHLAIAIQRINLQGAKLPSWMKADKIWGRRTGVEFVRKNIRHYMAKYFAKHNARIEGFRSYGMSLKGLKHLPDITLN